MTDDTTGITGLADDGGTIIKEETAGTGRWVSSRRELTIARLRALPWQPMPRAHLDHALTQYLKVNP